MREKAQHFDPRQEMQRKNYEIFHYRDAQPDSVAVHHHDFYEVYFFLGGNVEYSIEGQGYQLQPGDVLLISPMELHQPRIRAGADAYERIVLWLNPAFLAGLSTEQTSLTRCFDTSQPGHVNLLRLPPAPRAALLGYLSTLLRETYDSAYGGDVMATGVLLQLLAELNRLALDAGAARPASGRAAPLMARVLEHINDHYCEELTLDSLSARFYVSKYHLSHEFNRLVGTSVYRYIILKRLLIAKQMLAGGVPPTDVYRHCGFRDYSNFYRSFRAEYGISPKQYADSVR